MRITRHFVDIGARRVHYRRCGDGPALLMIHQSPRSSAEYEPLMQAWGEHFTCIAPDTPGFGRSDPLPGEPEIGAFADALLDLIDALRLAPVAAYGFHSGGIIAMAALKRRPTAFRALAIGGYAVWTAEEMALFSDRYLPPFRPSDYGEHLTWVWNRVLEQSWFFPWFAVAPEYRLSVAHDDVAKVDATVRDLLDSGDAYRAGYGAVLRAPRDIPDAAAQVPPVLITAYDGDPLQVHIDRLGPLPAGWTAAKVATPAEHHARSLAFLRDHPGAPPALVEATDTGFVRITAGGFDGLVRWQGTPGGTLHLHAPSQSLDLLDPSPGLAIDLPGHGLSDPWPDAGDWRAFVDAAVAQFGCTAIRHAPMIAGDPDRLFPDLAPDRFGGHLTRAWAIVRAAALFAPWYLADAAHARDFAPDALAPDRLARAHRALINAPAARSWATARRSMGE